ncbi:DUF2861 family protein [Vibrio sagamiensis]|uniref:DUF2861 domain-containing protein n=1 Tax=Vibrio sagamiensis NBRC 104589 TaxID=1219064 RepID=A0A511QGG7_9VIBR|nr:DUF2861 family protein [Vibrio sagamiensis]GEM76400.1 hypothetical protein VSA01S_25120 [Vibrio sagamiensis NBRC 104589]
MKLLIALLLVLISIKPAHSVDWFQSNSPLERAHKDLLEDELGDMFDDLVELLQRQPDAKLGSHLNDLLTQSLTKDCGQSLTSPEFPDWLKGVNIVHQTIQSPGRDSYKIVIEVRTTKEIEEIIFERWFEESISSDSLFNYEKEPVGDKDQDYGLKTYLKHYNISGRLEPGLYHLTIKNGDFQAYRAWVILGMSNSSLYVRWTSNDSWKVEKSVLINSFCPLPELEMSLFDYKNGEFEEVWKKNYKSNYPTSLPVNDVPHSRYVLALTISSRRWQGNISVEQAQTISRTFNVSKQVPDESLINDN